MSLTSVRDPIPPSANKVTDIIQTVMDIAANTYDDLSNIANGAFVASNSAPANANDAGDAGTIRYDANYVYVCVAANTWKRANLSTW